MIWLASTLTEWIAAVGGGIAGAVAAFIAIWQLPEIKRAGKLSARANVSQSYAVVSERMSNLQDVLMERPDWIPYFYEDESPSLGGRAKAKLDLICEAIADFADAVIEQRRTVTAYDPDGMDWSTWDAYFRFLYQNSPVLRESLRANRDFYPDYVFSVFGYIVVRDEESGALVDEWAVREWNRPDPDAEDEFTNWFDGSFGSGAGVVGYPWIRTWLITKIVGDAPTIVASVRPPGADATAEVRFACYPEGSGDPKEVMGVPDEGLFPPIPSWVLAQLQSSTRARRVEVFLNPRGTGQYYHARLRPAGRLGRRAWIVRRPPAREAFLAPAIPIEKRWWR
jgi:hypothetical protein